MKKLLTIISDMLFVTSANGLYYDNNTYECLQDILDNNEGEITIEDLQNINEFYCHKDVSTESFELLVKNLPDNTKVSIVQEDDEGNIEGIVFDGKFIANSIQYN